MAEDSNVALITTAQAKTFLKITGSTEDSIVDYLVNEASTRIATIAGRKFVSQAFNEYYDGNGLGVLMLRNYPVTALTSLYNADANRDFDATTEITIADDVILDGARGIIRLWNNEAAFNRGRGNVKVVYTAGYTKGPTGTMPYDLQHAALLTVLHTYKRNYQDQRIGIQSESIGQKNVTFENEEIPKAAHAIALRYRVVAQPDYAV